MARRSKKSTLPYPASVVLGAGVLVLALLAFFIKVSGPYFGAAVIQSQLVELTNVERTYNNVGTVTENALLDKAAQAKANDMAAKGYFAHVGPGGVEPWHWIDAAGYDYKYAGENLAVQFSESSDVVNAWMASPTHRANIVKPQYTEIGIGVADGTYEGQPTTFVVQYFAAPAGRVATQKVSGSGEMNTTPTPPPETFAPRSQQASSAVPIPGVAAAPSRANWWQQVVAFFATTLGLQANLASSGGVIIGESGVSTVR